jgi:hypothetical protein
LIVRLSLQL